MQLYKEHASERQNVVHKKQIILLQEILFLLREQKYHYEMANTTKPPALSDFCMISQQQPTFNTRGKLRFQRIKCSAQREGFAGQAEYHYQCILLRAYSTCVGVPST